MSFLFAFLTSASITVAFRGRLRVVLAAGLTGFLGFATHTLAGIWGSPPMLSVFLGALAVGIAGEVLARGLREPTILFVAPGLFPLVPGLMAYGGMLGLARGELAAAGSELTRTMFYTGALAAGLALPPVLLRRRMR